MDTNEIKERIDFLVKELNKHNYLYYVKDAPELSDYEYDMLMKELIYLEEKYPQFKRKNSPTQRVGGEPIKEFPSIKHEVPMLSIDNTYSEGELRNFDNRVAKILEHRNYTYAIELKIDGLAITVKYDKGELMYGATRGNGVIGDDVTSNIRTIRNIPLSIDYLEPIEVRGEIYIPKSKFVLWNEERKKMGLPVFANPRNTASGSLKLQDPKECAKRPLSAIFYDIVNFGNTHKENIQFLKKLYFPVEDEFQIADNINEVIKLCEYWEHHKDELDMPVDGIVIKINEIEYRKILGNTAKSPRWCIAYKFKTEKGITKLKSVDFQVGRLGNITPVANLDPVYLSGTIVSRSTLHNFDIIEELDVRVGDDVIVEKAGEIIPHIVGVKKDRRTGDEKIIEPPKECPICHTKLIRYEDEVNWVCPNYWCPERIKRRIEHFASKDAMNIEGLGSAIVNELVNRKYITDYADLYELKYEQLVNLEGFADLSAKNLLSSIETSKKRDLDKLIYGLGIRYVGKKIARILAINFLELDRLMIATKEDLISIDEIGEKIANQIVQFFNTDENLQNIEKLRNNRINFELFNKPNVSEDNFFYDKSIVLTGSLEHFTRNELTSMLEGLGGKVKNSVSKKTDIVIVGKNPGSKYDKAQKLGIFMLKEDELLQKLGK